jgi:hypothetical protein
VAPLQFPGLMQKSPHRQESGSPGTGSPNRGLNVHHFCVEGSQNGRQRHHCLAAESWRLGPKTGQSSCSLQGGLSVPHGRLQCQTQEDPRSEIIALTPHLRGRSLTNAYLLPPTSTSERAQMHTGMLCRRCRHARRAANRLCGSAGASACHYDSGHAAGDVREARSYWFHLAESIGGSAIYNIACFWSRPGSRSAAKIRLPPASGAII